MEICPKCHRKLLSLASSRCNWCGELIDDPAYQQDAEKTREAYFKHEAESDELTLARTRWIDINNSMMGRQFNTWSNGPIPVRTRSRPEPPPKARWKGPPDQPSTPFDIAGPVAAPDNVSEDSLAETSANESATSAPGIEYAWQPGITPTDAPLNPQLTELEIWHTARMGKPRKKPGKNRR